jgi:DNA-binding GntR family transcriptional regulator
MATVIHSTWPETQSIGGRLGPRIYESLKDRLISGRWAHGERLSVEALREEFGVSKQPIMESMRLLSAEGLVEIIPQVGCEVATFGTQEVIDFFAMFASFEGTIAAAAAQRRTAEQLGAMADGVVAFERLPEIVDDSLRSRRYFELNRKFHRQIHEMSGSRTMSAISRRMWDMSDFLINTTGVPHPMATATAGRHAEHEVIRAALENGDSSTAKQAMEHHMLSTVELILPADLV